MLGLDDALQLPRSASCNGPAVVSPALQTMPFALAGPVLAAAHAAGVAYNARLYGRPGARTRAAFVHMARSALLAGVLVAMGRWNAAGLLVALLVFAGSHPLVVAALARRA